MPSFDGSDKAVTRRIKVIPWKQSFSLNGTQDDNLADKLEADKDNTLSFLLFLESILVFQDFYLAFRLWIYNSIQIKFCKVSKTARTNFGQEMVQECTHIYINTRL